jgi:hypothetical protein
MVPLCYHPNGTRITLSGNLGGDAKVYAELCEAVEEWIQALRLGESLNTYCTRILRDHSGNEKQ